MDARYPIGPFGAQAVLTAADRLALVESIAGAPAALRAAVRGLADEQLDTPYRPGGWTVRQVVHHLADSHMNSSVRFRLALTQEHPTIAPYDEKRWAELVDARTGPLEPSLALLESLHERWVRLLRSLAPAEWARTFHHPEAGVVSLDLALQQYGWHGRHHIAQITALRERMSWAAPETAAGPAAQDPDADGPIAGLIEGWCARRALGPLRLLLPAWPHNGLTDGVAELRNALGDVRALARGALVGDEATRVAEAVRRLDRALDRG